MDNLDKYPTELKTSLSAFLQFLAQTRTLWTTFTLTIILTICFGVVMHLGKFGIIDEMFIAEDIRAHINAMSPHQRSLHAWMTGTLDIVYPFAYGAFFIGIAVRYFARFGIWLALPSFLVIPADLAEGFAQVMLLTGNENFMSLKVVATQAKLILYIAGLGITFVGLLLALKEILNRKGKSVEHSSFLQGKVS